MCYIYLFTVSRPDSDRLNFILSSAGRLCLTSRDLKQIDVKLIGPEGKLQLGDKATRPSVIGPDGRSITWRTACLLSVYSSFTSSSRLSALTCAGFSALIFLDSICRFVPVLISQNVQPFSCQNISNNYKRSVLPKVILGSVEKPLKQRPGHRTLH